MRKQRNTYALQFNCRLISKVFDHLNFITVLWNLNGSSDKINMLEEFRKYAHSYHNVKRNGYTLGDNSVQVLA